MMTTLTAPSPGPASLTPRRDLPAAIRAGAVAIIAALAVVIGYSVFVRTQSGQDFDQSALEHLADGTESRLTVASWLRNVSVGAAVLTLGGCVVIGVVRRRYATAVLAVALVAGANVTTQLLKHVVFTRPHLGHESTNTLPSGHTTVVTSLVLAALLVAPYAWRGLVSLVGAVGVAVAGVGTVVANWHRPSDVLAALCVSLAWGTLALTVVSVMNTRQAPPRTARAHSLALIVGLAVAAGLFVEVGVRPNGTTRDLTIHVVIMCGLALAGAVVVGLFARMVNSRIA
jgi:membrane-associated phospholipid phosphatase